ncbi:MAG: mechanosensitive ion channel family protein [Candidatus Bathyarchaeota archaeon]|nr:mechanosensitive ion channel family protein [Candidatus Bathyarchaeota archaeon]
MVKRSRLAVLVVLAVASVLLWFVNCKYPSYYLVKTFYTVLASTIIYFIFEIVLSEVIRKRVKESKTRYSLRKVVAILTLATFLVTFASIWIGETQNILITFGLVGAGVAIAVQDVFKNFVGGLMLFVNGVYRAGDRVEINGKMGDVIDVGILYTTLMETREWVSGDQVTGRLTIIPNGVVLSGVTQNYTRDFDFIWDEISIPITYDSDWNAANTLILEIVKRETKEIVDNAQKNMTQIEEKYYVTKRSLQPAIFVSLTDNWITFDIRYITEVWQRRVLHDKLSRLILSEIEKAEKVKIASATMEIVGFPPVKLKKEPE